MYVENHVGCAKLGRKRFNFKEEPLINRDILPETPWSAPTVATNYYELEQPQFIRIGLTFLSQLIILSSGG